MLVIEVSGFYAFVITTVTTLCKSLSTTCYSMLQYWKWSWWKYCM